MPDRAISAQRGRGFIPPRFSHAVHVLIRIAGPVYMRVAQRVSRLRMMGMESLASAMIRFQRGERRVILLFRHVAVADGPVIMQLVDRELPRWCRRNHRRLLGAPHIHFLYGKDVLNWAGAAARWAFPRLGGIPVMNGRMDRSSHGAIRSILLDGRFPLAFAPEAQVTYHQYTVHELAAGTATLASWANTDLQARGSAELQSVELVPIAIGYTYGRRSASVIRSAVARLERELAAFVRRDTDPAVLDPLALTAAALSPLERALGVPDDATEEATPPALQKRIDGICDAALCAGERVAGFASDRGTLERVFRLRAWLVHERYREDVDPQLLAPPERGIADARAMLATGARTYERIADIAEYLRADYLPDVLIVRSTGEVIDRATGEIAPPASVDRTVEYLLNLIDVLGRAAGGDVDTRFTPRGRTARLLVGESIDASSVLDSEPRTRDAVQSLRSKVASAFADLVTALERDTNGERS